MGQLWRVMCSGVGVVDVRVRWCVGGGKEENGGQLGGPHIYGRRALNLLLELELHNKVEKIVGRGNTNL